jgi:hypothetical protein
LKSGKELNILLNYNIVTEKFVFLQKGEIFDIINPLGVDTVYIQNRKFILVEKRFYEVALNARIPLLIQHKGKIHAAPKPAPYGGTTEISSSIYIKSIQVGSDLYKLKSDPSIVIKPEKVYWLKINDSAMWFQTENQLIKIMPDIKNEIKQFIKQNKLKFSSAEDVMKILVYCNSIKI